MTTPSRFRGVLSALGIVLLSVPCPAIGLVTSAGDPEDSPLYANSMRQTFADMEARGHGLSLPLNRKAQTRVAPSPVVVVEGMRWSYGGGPGLNGNGTVRPLGVTTDVTCTDPTCSYTCARSCSAPCGPTYDEGGATCHDYATCHVPGPTCIYQTCTGGPTCEASQPTCFGVSCTEPGLTCSGSPTCVGVTCLGTCAPEQCPTTLFNVYVPRVGEIQMSFSSSSYLKYLLQCCTNLAAGPWTEACSTNGTGGVLTLCHTNGAAASLYRLVIQNR